MAGAMEATSAERQQQEIRLMLADLLAPNGRQQGTDGAAEEGDDPRRAFIQALAKRALARQQEEQRALGPLSAVPEAPDERVEEAPARPPVASNGGADSNGLSGVSPEEAVLQRYEARVRRLQAETLARFKSSVGALTELCLAELRGPASQVAEQGAVLGP